MLRCNGNGRVATGGNFCGTTYETLRYPQPWGIGQRRGGVTPNRYKCYTKVPHDSTEAEIDFSASVMQTCHATAWLVPLTICGPLAGLDSAQWTLHRAKC